MPLTETLLLLLASWRNRRLSKASHSDRGNLRRRYPRHVVSLSSPRLRGLQPGPNFVLGISHPLGCGARSIAHRTICNHRRAHWKYNVLHGYASSTLHLLRHHRLDH